MIKRKENKMNKKFVVYLCRQQIDADNHNIIYPENRKVHIRRINNCSRSKWCPYDDKLCDLAKYDVVKRKEASR